MMSAERMVAQVERHIGAIPAIYKDALLAVDRTRFVRPRDRDRAWADEPLPLDTPHGAGVATVSAPHMYVLGFRALGLGKGDSLLELGSGSGYGAALAAHVVGAEGLVTTVEVDPHLAKLTLTTTARIPNVKVLHDDGLRRPDLVARHDKIWLTFSVSEPPRALLEALRQSARLVAPVGVGEEQRFVRYTKSGETIGSEDLGAVRFVPARPLIAG
ncbi:MAG: protein-L-isoaspartate O-methyltransferase family protein [Polyangiales bacterium]